VELAQLNYMLPRITEKFGSFEQQTGGIGTRGPGERKLEIDQRRIRDRITRIRREVSDLREHRDRQRESRDGVPFPVVALVGYTNAGKSSLLNALRVDRARAVYADDKLFATLDPTARRVKLPGGRPAVFVDTVGFIQNLPHHLVSAFHATLEAAKDADLLIHVVDASHPDWERQSLVVGDVLKSLDAADLPRLTAFNKADAVPLDTRGVFLREDAVLISARTGDGLPDLLSRVEKVLESGMEEREILLPHDRRDLLPIFYGTGHVLSEKPGKGGDLVRARLDPRNWGRIEKALTPEKKK
jgi:GTPase